MKFDKSLILSHLDSLIERQQQDLEELLSVKPKIPAQIERAKGELHGLRSLRNELVLDKNQNHQKFMEIERDLLDLGWDKPDERFLSV